MEYFNEWEDKAVPGALDEMSSFDLMHLFKIIRETAKEEIYNREFEIENEKNEQDSENYTKITLNGSVQMWGFLFRELITKGYIGASYKGSKLSDTNTAKLLLQHFEFSANPNQPTLDYLRKAISNDNTLAESKKETFKIPNLKNLE